MRYVMLVAVAALALSAVACGSAPEGVLRIGAVAPSLKTKTLADVDGDFSRITTYRYPDKRMYQYSLDEAMQSGKPVVLEFATPGHCTVCDKQLQMLKGILDKYEKSVVFVHMDQYENPEAFTAYRVMGDPWTFVIDTDHIVRFRQPGRMLFQELDLAIQNVLNQKQG